MILIKAPSKTVVQHSLRCVFTNCRTSEKHYQRKIQVVFLVFSVSLLFQSSSDCNIAPISIRVITGWVCALFFGGVLPDSTYSSLCRGPKRIIWLSLSHVTEVTMDLGALDYASKLIVIYVPAVQASPGRFLCLFRHARNERGTGKAGIQGVIASVNY